MSDDARPAFEAGQVVTVFRSRLRSGDQSEYHSTAAEMLALAREMPGFVDFKSFGADDGERVSVITFADRESQRGWREHVDHRVAQAAGRDRFYAEYSIQVSDCVAAHSFTAT
jgi:heme-degrading monooxygenase HmoA